MPKSAVSALVVVGQLYVTAVCGGLMLIVYHSRPDIEVADPSASVLRCRRFLAAFTRVLLTMAALVNTSLLLAAVAMRAGQGRSRLNGNVRGLTRAAGTDRDDDRFWPACSTSTAMAPPSRSRPASASAGRSTSATGPRG